MDFAVRFIIMHIIMVVAESTAPIKNIILNAISLGIGSAEPAEEGTTKSVKNTPEITGPMAPPIILMVAFVAETIPVASFGVWRSIRFGTSVIKTPPKANPNRTSAVSTGVEWNRYRKTIPIVSIIPPGTMKFKLPRLIAMKPTIGPRITNKSACGNCSNPT